MNNIVNGLWIEGNLSSMELLTVASFTQNGFVFHLWTYTPETINAPSNCIVRNATEILSKDHVFAYQSINKHGHGKGSFAGFSDIFRYKLLYEHGGIWTDMDITCLKNFRIDEDYLFRYHHKSGAVGNFMKCPKSSPLMLWCFEEAVRKVTADNTDWMLPITILNEGIARFKLNSSIRKLSNDDSFPVVARMLTSAIQLPEDWKIIHWMNEEFRRNSIPKETCIADSQLARLYKKYEIPYTVFSSYETLKYKILLSRFVYLLRNIKSTLSWYVLPK
jgi:hypothetical protein